jgi:hypothetical protein
MKLKASGTGLHALLLAEGGREGVRLKAKALAEGVGLKAKALADRIHRHNF